jgi:hypothetical protein
MENKPWEQGNKGTRSGEFRDSANEGMVYFHALHATSAKPVNLNWYIVSASYNTSPTNKKTSLLRVFEFPWGPFLVTT